MPETVLLFYPLFVQGIMAVNEMIHGGTENDAAGVVNMDDEDADLAVFNEPEEDEIFGDKVPSDHIITEEQSRELMDGAMTVPLAKMMEHFKDVENVSVEELEAYLEANMSIADQQGGQDERLDALREQMLVENATDASDPSDKESVRKERRSRSERVEVDVDAESDDDSDAKM
jgi:predicted house-cleaning noncanonical NTP pyrophosphatase (MazG superfamily)